MLRVEGLCVSYGGSLALAGVNFEVHAGEVVAIVGSNGAGKTTALKTISGVLRPDEGTIEFCNERLDRLPAHEVVTKGIALVPEGRRLFSKLSVLENLLLGAYTNTLENRRKAIVEQIFEIFPILRDRQGQRTGTLSGGEQQMLAIGRALMSQPKLLMLDEPSLGIMPVMVEHIFEVVQQLNAQGTTILLVEQNVRRALELAHRGYVLRTGRIVLQGTGQELLESDQIRKAYLGL